MLPSTNTKNISIKCVGNIHHGAAGGATSNTSTQGNDAKAQWEGMLRRYDANGDRRISKKELKEAFKNAGSSMPRWRAFRALRHADKNGDGFIEEAELPGVLEYAAKKGYVL